MKRHPTNARENAALITEDGRLRSFLNGGRVFKLNWTKVRVLELAILNRLFSRDKKDNRLIENMVVIGSTQNTCWYVDYKFRTSWIAFNAFS